MIVGTHVRPNNSDTFRFAIRTYRTISASEYSDSCFSRKQAKTSSQWNVPLCVPIFIAIRAFFAWVGSALICFGTPIKSFVQTEKITVNTSLSRKYNVTSKRTGSYVIVEIFNFLGLLCTQTLFKIHGTYDLTWNGHKIKTYWLIKSSLSSYKSMTNPHGPLAEPQ